LSARTRPAIAAGVAAILCLVLVVPASAEAGVERFRLRSAPFTLADFNVKFPKLAIPAPRRDGYLTDMDVRLVDERGQRVTIRDVMLHHVLFKNNSRRGLTRGGCPQSNGESFYGTGEERQTLDLPEGYGYRVGRTDRWRMNVMLMSHTARVRKVYVEYFGTIVTGRALRGVRPFWLSAHGCSANPSYGVYGGGGRGAVHNRKRTWRLPIGGRIVAAGGHLHGGALNMTVRQPRCRRKLFDHRPLYGAPGHIYYRARPLLHEPGPINTRWFASPTGIRINARERLEVIGTYDNSAPHSRVMAITHVYVHPRAGAERGCSPIPRDARQTRRVKHGRTTPPFTPVPLNRVDRRGRVSEIDELPGPFQTFGMVGQSSMRAFRFTPSNVRIPAGGSIRWTYGDAEPHNVTFADGPRLISAPTLSRGRTYIRRFDVPGRYKLFCYLHPVTMHQIVDVTPTGDPGQPAPDPSQTPPADAPPGTPMPPPEGPPPAEAPPEGEDPAAPSAI